MTNHALQLIVDGKRCSFQEGDSALTAMLRTDLHPTGGGCLCAAGDCGNCLATVDGVSYVRTCTVSARPGLVIDRHHHRMHPHDPPLPHNTLRPEVPVTYAHCETALIGLGASGRAELEKAYADEVDVMLLEASQGHEVIGIYPGPLVIVRTPHGMLHVHPHKEIIIATGAADIQPVAQGNHLMGIVSARAAIKLRAAGLALGRAVIIGTPTQALTDLGATPLTGTLVRFEGDTRVEAVVVADERGEQRVPCDTVIANLGRHPRNALVRMACDLPVRAVGSCAQPSDIPPCPTSGLVCSCAGVHVEQLNAVYDRGFTELELVKRATLAGTGTCQGSACLPHLRSFLLARGHTLQPPFTARPVTKQLTMGEIAAGGDLHPTPRTALHEEHVRLGAHLDRIGGWWRPWNYGDLLSEYWAVREAVSICDVSTLGKMRVHGPDALEFLERLYPTQVSTIKPGRARYVLLLDERGYVIDDGLIAKHDDQHYSLTFTSGGSGFAEAWVRDWAESWGYDVRILNQTSLLGGINVTGPLATTLLARAGLAIPLKFMRHVYAEVAEVPCHIYRLSFTGEVSYELHHPAAKSSALWRILLELGRDLGIKPHGLEALTQLRLEKGHIVVGQDSDLDSTPRRLHHEWMVNLNKPQDFIGKQAVLRTNKLPLDRQLVGFEMDGPAPPEGATVWEGTSGQGDDYAGYLTSSGYAPILGKSVMLGWLRLRDGQLADEVTIDGRVATRVATPFYDKEGQRARA